MGVVFEDLHEYDGNHTVYPVVNESIKAWNDVLDGIKVERAGSICSGGEVSFFCILPHVTKELDALDHSYKSLYFAVGKYHLIEKLGTKEAFKALSENRKDDLRALFDEASKDLPMGKQREKDAELFEAEEKRQAASWKRGEKARRTRYDNDKAYYDRHYGKGYYERSFGTWEQQNSFRYTHLRGGRSGALGEWFNGWWESAERVYKEVEQAGITEFRKNRDKVRFVHGDLKDLKDRGPYDLVYLSNAPSYAGRNGMDYKPAEWVKPGGYVCYTTSGGGGYARTQYEVDKYGNFKYDKYGSRIIKKADPSGKQLDRHGLEIVKEINPRDKKYVGSFGYGMSWTYRLCKTPDEGSANEEAASDDRSTTRA